MNDLYSSRLNRQIRMTTREGRAVRFFRNPLKTVCRPVLEGYARKTRSLVPVHVRTFWGDSMRIVVPERSSSYILKFGFWEEDVTTMMIRYLKAGDILFDVGAHLGYFTLLGGAIVTQAGQVHAFEPAKWAFDVLGYNIRGRRNCTVHQKAVFKDESVLTFYDYGPIDSLFNSLYAISDREPITAGMAPSACEVETVSLDDYIAETGVVPDMVKIDAETAEHEVLEGAARLIDRKRTIFILEVGGLLRENASSEQAAARLLQKGYTPHEYRDGDIVRHELRKDDHYRNLLFLPP